MFKELKEGIITMSHQRESTNEETKITKKELNVNFGVEKIQ